MPRALLAAVALLGFVPVAAAAARDDALRLAPPDAGFVLVVQNAHDHLAALAVSPFVKWFPSTRIGQQITAGADLAAAREAVGAVFRELKLDITPQQASADVLGGVVAFAFTPSSSGDSAVLLVRGRKPETVRLLVERLNAVQTAGGEVKAVVRREHRGREYFERQKSPAGSEFFGFVGDVFAFTTSEADIRGVLDRAAADAPTVWADRLHKLGVVDAAAVLLVNPRAFDAELRAKVAAAPANERVFLTRFQEVWSALETGCVYLDLGRELDLGVALRFRSDALPPALKPFLTGARTPSALWPAVPENALFAAAGSVTPADLLAALGALTPDNKPVRAGIEAAVGPVIGRDRLAAVLAAVGPDWAVWAEPPAAGSGPLPVLMAAVRVRSDGAAADAPVAVQQLLDWAFLMARVGYNAGHPDQISLREERHDGVVIKSLVNDKGFPPGFRPSFALTGGFLLVSTSPDAIKAFRPPTDGGSGGGDVPAARFSASAVRSYLAAHTADLSKLLSAVGAGKEAEVRGQLEHVAAALELLESVNVLTRGDENGVRVWVRVRFAKPLK